MGNHLFIQVRNDMEAEVVISLASVVDAPAIAKLNLLFNEVDESVEAGFARIARWVIVWRTFTETFRLNQTISSVYAKRLSKGKSHTRI